MNWRLDQLADCLPALLRAAGLAMGAPSEIPRVSEWPEMDAWVPQTAKRLGCEADGLTVTHRELPSELTSCLPALLRMGDRFIAAVSERHGRLRVLCPDGELLEIATSVLCAEMRKPAEGDRRSKLEDLLEQCGIRGKARSRSADLLILDELGQSPVQHGWIFRESCSAPMSRWLKQVHAVGHAARLLVSHAFAYGLWVLSWVLLGSLSLSGRMDRGWLWGWSLLISSFVVCRVLGTWYQGRLAIGLSGLLKRRLLAGVLRLDPTEIRRAGMGSFLGQTFEAESLETLALGGGLASVLATVDLLLSGFVLGRMAVLLAAWFALAVFLGWRFLRKYELWTANRLSLTQDLTESMVGHRTRLVQQPPEKWHTTEDQALDAYYGYSEGVDRIGAFLVASIPRGWMLVGLLCVAQTVVAGGVSNTETAILLGGILLSWSAFERLVASLPDVAAAYVAWKRIGYLFGAASRPELLGSVAGDLTKLRHSDEHVVEVDRLTFRHRSGGAPVLDGCNLAVRKNDRILLEGPSGGGKTTLASLLAGERQSESGLILAGGLDMQTLGREGWRKQVVLVPQFHENHLLTETLAFNLLFGRHWPPAAADLQQADEVCRGLGLGAVLDRMPNGLMQMVGDGGWRLSHGEQSRVFVARGLLQNPSLTILDESFGALDPESLQTAMEFTLRRAQALVVIAHT